MSVIHMLQGLPASGKTTLARQMVERGIKRVSKDDLRAMLHNGVYTPELETFVIDVRDAIIEIALRRGFDVVVDDTNLNPAHREALSMLADALGGKLDVIKLRTSVTECIQRDALRKNSVGEEVIKRMADQYVQELEDEEKS